MSFLNRKVEILDMKEFYIGGRRIAEDVAPLVIAEIGINHGGSLEVAKNLVELAARSGCECVKHQTHFVADEMTEEAKKIFPPNDDRSIWEIIDSCALTRDEEIQLKNFAESLDLLYISTPFSRSAADFLEEIDVPAFKIGSGECNNIPLLRHIAKKGKPVIMSTGMESIENIRKSVAILDSYNIPVLLLECTNLYPSPPEIVSLRGVTELRDAFPDKLIGFSDHSIGPEMALASVALGAVVIERHFTDSRYRKGPDISCSMDPAELRFIIDRSSEIQKSATNPKGRSGSEEAVYRFARGSIVADKDLSEGHVISEQDIWARRPGTGEIPAIEFDSIVGRTLNTSVVRNQQLRYRDFND